METTDWMLMGGGAAMGFAVAWILAWMVRDYRAEDESRRAYWRGYSHAKQQEEERGAL